MNMNPNGKSFNLGGEWISWQKYLDQAANNRWSDFDWQKEFGFSQNDAIVLAEDNLEDLLGAIENVSMLNMYKVSKDMYNIYIRRYEPYEVDSFPCIIIHYGTVNTYPVYKVEYLFSKEEEYYDFTTMSNEEIVDAIFEHVKEYF